MSGPGPAENGWAITGVQGVGRPGALRLVPGPMLGSMNDDLREKLEQLERIALETEAASKRALGFTGRIEYKGISFNVSKRFVIADLSPLAFFHLVERNEHLAEPNQDGAKAAVARLYDRLLPLLSCRHKWTVLKRSDDDPVRKMGGSREGGPLVHICMACTAYALGEELPEIGRGLGDAA